MAQLLNDIKNYDIAVLIPCYNEEATIAKVVKDFRTALPSARIYVYDNNSTDNTSSEAAGSGAEVVKERRQGKGNVIKSMFRNIDADIYVLVDGDDTYPAEEVMTLIDALVSEDYDMVIGDRLSSTYFIKNKRKFHNGGNRLVCWTINKFFNSHIKDALSGYRVFNRDFVKSFPILSHGFEIETEMTLHALDKDFRIKEIPVTYSDRPEGSVSKLNTFRDGYKVMKMIAILFRDYRPLAFFSMIASLVFILGVAFLIPVLLEYGRTGLVPKFPTLIASCAIILSAILLELVGIILQAIAKHHRRLYELMKLKRQ